MAESQLEGLRERLTAVGQDHVLRFWPELDAAGRSRLAAQLEEIDFEALGRALAGIRARASAPPASLEPAKVVRFDAGLGRPDDSAARERGEALLASGRVAVLVVAGGQATRLGFAGPKGAYPIGPVSDRSLFEIHAQRIRRIRRRHGAPLPWYVMTSAATHAATRSFFAGKAHFDLPQEEVFFFSQRSVPAVDFEGRMLLDAPDHVFESPDGHGGVIPALAASGALDDLESRGISSVFLWQIDNPLVRIADPVYLGLHAAVGAEASCKVVAKRDPLEKVGHVAMVDGRLGIIEYTEIDATHREARDERGDLVYWAGGISIYVFETDFLRRVSADAERRLPFHASPKRIPALDRSGRRVEPIEPNGWKLERFVFDALPAARTTLVVETTREEYSPLKNASGSESPETVRRDLSTLYRRWLVEAGIEPPPEDALIELDQSLFDGAVDLRERGISRIADSGESIRIASGAQS
ncbi:UDP-N-acetylglucosamine/UDP-N-acetylgalactosaminediphosphorylase [Myxococcaceae bacterium]|nr:UDP-N-acetylglucosamine/UDP-N-acetylgalactosaminediphosphorylase [Myxococcaceae bacterium]